MDELMRVMAAKKREAALVQAQKKEKYLRRSDVEAIQYATSKRDDSSMSNSSALTGASKSTDTTLNSSRRRHTDASDTTHAASNTDTTDAANSIDTHTAKKRKLDSEPSTTAPVTTTADDEATYTLPWPELKKRLRDIGEPIRLFGETARARVDRLRRAEHDAASRQEDALHGGHARRFGQNEQAQHAAEHADDAADDAQDFDAVSRPVKASASASTSCLEATDAANVDESDLDKLVYRFFKRMLQAWEADLAARPDHVKRTAQGKIATQTMKQCKDYIRPLFKLCKQRQVPSDILPNLVEIVKCCVAGEFVMANDQYIRLAIGNAAWPIGVTMVGIHERTGREKISNNKQAHVMNNESQRKYLTSVKRLISYAQSISNVLPSKKVMV